MERKTVGQKETDKEKKTMCDRELGMEFDPKSREPERGRVTVLR